jgi:hypothetical protein
MSALYSDRLAKRNFQIQITRDNNYSEINTGEITGEQLLFDNIDQGMPVRSSFTPNKNDKKNIIDDYANDFSLFDNSKNNNIHNFKVNSYDPYENTKDMIDTNNILTNEINNISNNIDEFGYNLFIDIQKNLLKIKYLLCSYSLFILLSILFISSKNKTFLELKNFLNLHNKSNILTNINLLNTELENIKYFNITNLLIIPYTYKINKSFLNNLPNIKILNYDNRTQDLYNECLKINKYLNNYYNINLTNTIKPEYINNKSIISLITGKIEPIWENNFDDIIIDKFYSYNIKDHNFLLAKNKQYYHCFHNNLELIDIPTYDKKLSFGIITTTSDYFPTINNEVINLLISKLTKTTFKYLIIPQINNNFKMRYTNTLNIRGLHSIFNDLDISELLLSSNNDNI